MRGDEVTDEDEDGHDDVFGDGDDIGACHFGDGDTAVGLVGCVQVDVVGADTSGNGNLELLGFCETLGGEVAGVETVQIYMLPVEGRVLALLIRGSNESMSLILKPFANTELVLRCA